MPKTLYAIGCSHTAGTDIAMDGRLDLTYPFVFGDRIGYDVVNHGLCGSSNESIVRRTVEYVSSSPVPPDMVIVQLTNPIRFETPKRDINPRSYLEYVDESGDDYLQGYDFFKSYMAPSKENYLYWEKKMFQQILLLQTFFTEFGIDDYIFIRYNYLKNPEILNEYPVSLHIDFNKHLFGKNSPGLFSQLLYNEYRYHKEDHHFGIDGHNKISDWLYEHVNNLEHENILKDVYDNLEYDKVYRYDV